jgi:benzylsuccinate CoA-transferase BbsF subunit
MDALTGVRIIDFSWAYAGPYAAELLALMGAEVIKIESRKRPCITRRQPHPITGQPYDIDDCPYFKDLNMNKLGVALNLSQPKAIELAKRLVERSDVVVESFTPGVMSRLGLGYEVLRSVNPSIIMLSSSANGTTGPEARYAGYAPMFNATSGLGELTGYPDGPPTVMRITIDNVVAHLNAFAILAALIYRQETGEGQYIDAASQEVIACLIGDSIMDYTMNGRVQSRDGNRDEIMAPHNCYRCLGEDKWINIAVSTEEEWQILCQVMGNPDWSKEARFSDAYNRWQNQEELDKLLESWTINYSNYDLMHTLQKAGVAAVPSFTSEDLFADPHLAEREFSQVFERPRTGNYVIIAPPWKLSATPARIVQDAPSLGEHNEYVFGKLLGISREEINKLQEEGVLY